MIRADIETEVNPIVGSKKQSEELVHFLLSKFETDPAKIWESNIFGKSLVTNYTKRLIRHYFTE